MTKIIQNSVNASSKKQTDKVGLPQVALGVAGGAVSAFALTKASDVFQIPTSYILLKNIKTLTLNDKETMFKEADKMVKESEITKKGFNGIILVDNTKNGAKSFETKNIIKNIIKDYIKNNKRPAKISEIKSYFKNMLKQVEIQIEKMDVPIHNPSEKIPLDVASKKFYCGFITNILKGSLGNKLTYALGFITEPASILSKILTGEFNIKNMNKQMIENGIKFGCFEPVSNRIFTANPASIFHEIGHAINKNTNFLTKMPSRIGLISSMILIPSAILTAIFSKKPQKKDETSKTQNSFEKLKEFVHNHIGLTVAGLSIPLLLEEVLASYRAVKFVNGSKVLSEAAKKSHNKILQAAFCSHLIGVVVFASAAKLAVVVKDKIIEHTSKNKNKTK